MAGETRRIALVIGNSAYVHGSRLANPGNDARGIAAALTRLGFAGISPDGQDFSISLKVPGVAALADLEYNAFRCALAAFGRVAEHADQAILYYAGHGVEVGGLNYLIPVDAKLAHAKDVEFETASLMQVLGAVDGASGLRLIILDACRDNPFRARLFAGREMSRGLRAIEPTGNILVAYAAKHGTVALDGNGINSPYATALLAHIEEVGLEIMDLFREVKDDVLEATCGQQEPYLYGSLGRRREYLVPPDLKPATEAPESAPFDPVQVELQWWERVKHQNNAALVTEFLQRYPDGALAPLARDRLVELEWKRVRATRDDAEIEAFLLQWPGSPYEETARARLAALLRKQSEGFKIPGKMVAGTIAGVLLAGVAGYALWPAPETGSATYNIAGASETESRSGKVGGIVRTASGDDEEKWFVPGEGKIESFRDCINSECANSPEMVVVPAGSFMMGSPDDEKQRYDDERPQVMVTFDQPFAVGASAVTRDEFEAFVTDTNRKMDGGCRTWDSSKWKDAPDRSWRSPGFTQTGSHPVTCVNWLDAQGYAEWLSKKTGKPYRLLSEAEREYVTRAGTVTPFWWGTSITPDQANYDGNYSYDGGGEKGEYRKATVPVKSFQPNPWGLYQVHGNVWDWTRDCGSDSHKNAPSDGSARATGECSRRILRGGSWNNGPRSLRAANRGRYRPEVRLFLVGFRVSRTL